MGKLIKDFLKVRQIFIKMLFTDEIVIILKVKDGDVFQERL